MCRERSALGDNHPNRSWRDLPNFDILIRTYNSAETIRGVLSGISSLSSQPSQIVVVDSGSTDDTVTICKAFGCSVYNYEGDVFNYSRSLNQGFRRVVSPYCLVLSSHVVIVRPDLVERMFEVMRVQDAKGVYVDFCRNDDGITIIDRDSFNGHNGLWNPCALYATELVESIGFDEALPTAEDQHFALSLFDMGYTTAALSGNWVKYLNPRVSLKKDRNEYVSIAYFTFKKNLAMSNIFCIAKSALRNLVEFRFTIFYDRSALALRLLAARLRKPRFKSKYF